MAEVSPQSPPLRSRFYGLKIRVAGLLCLPLLGRLIGWIYQQQIPNRGCVIFTGSDFVKPSVKASLYWGFYEAAEVRFVQKHLRADLDVVELGSSLGGVSAQIIRRLERSRRLICVEANPDLLPLLRRNVAANSSGAGFEMEQGAVHYGDEGLKSVRLALGGDNTTSHVSENQAEQQSVEVTVLTLGGILKKHAVGDFALVCDIEGAEAGLFERDGAALDCCQQVIVELHETDWNGRHFSVAQLQQRLEENSGFHMLDQHGPVCVFERRPARA